MKVFVCFFALFVAAALGEPCPSVCPAIYNPVCCTYQDRTYRTFSNGCASSAYNCPREISCASQSEAGVECQDVDIGQCEGRMCPMVIDPVCCTYADNSPSTTYSNICMAEVALKCDNAARCHDLTKGECAE
ncbi:enhancer of split M1 protein-like [Phlebotomus argentipes]|uniref:enhancer of split M1 protein-like n=1 Tax=Phlebotomus argentipes TaxID=94469 RepID=UPI0028930B96|nr:enhancer of split M1 protein-like [Phlebotomus argentipes]